MSSRYGRPWIECQCADDRTCRACLQAAPPWHNTPSTISEQAARPWTPPPTARATAGSPEQPARSSTPLHTPARKGSSRHR